MAYSLHSQQAARNFRLGTFLLLGADLIGLWSSWQSMQAFEGAVAARHAEAGKILQTQVEFKIQAQEWKNVLLRGSNSEALGKYWGLFEQHESNVAANLDELLQKVNEPAARGLLQQFQSVHKTMGENCRKGLQASKDARFDTKTGNQAAKGMDRMPNELRSKSGGQNIRECRRSQQQHC